MYINTNAIPIGLSMPKWKKLFDEGYIVYDSKVTLTPVVY